MWELLTFGAQPFEDIHPDEVLEMIEKGGRPPQPINCPDQLWVIIVNQSKSSETVLFQIRSNDVLLGLKPSSASKCHHSSHETRRVQRPTSKIHLMSHRSLSLFRVVCSSWNKLIRFLPLFDLLNHKADYLIQGTIRIFRALTISLSLVHPVMYRWCKITGALWILTCK